MPCTYCSPTCFRFSTEDARHKLLRTLYGTLCFAIFFSFVGTVLGGLWADDSWGRFWGWDPKENGALMIVLWNALVLHARWGGLVKGRGLATLAVAGNIITTWSYFGVNELGVGLHAYGASEKNTSMWLLIFAASQLALIALGMMPQHWFDSCRTLDAQAFRDATSRRIVASPNTWLSRRAQRHLQPPDRVVHAARPIMKPDVRLSAD